MDILSIIGIVLGLIAIIGGAILKGSSAGALVGSAAFVIVVVGTLAASLVQTPMSTFLRAWKIISWVFKPPAADPTAMIEKIVEWSNVARKQGLLGLEPAVEQERDEFLKKGLQSLVDGGEPEAIRASMGLMAVMQNLNDPSKLGHGIAAAFVATIYGIAFANLLFLPMSNKLKAVIHGQMQVRTMVIEGLIAIAQGENPRNIESKLQGYFHH